METRVLSFWRNRVLLTLFLGFLVIILVLCLIFIPMVFNQTRGIKAGVYLGDVAIGGYDPSEVEKLLLNEAEKFLCWPVAANITHEGVITQAIQGQILDISATMQAVLKAHPGEKIEPVFCPLNPVITSEEILALTHSIGTYHTFVGGAQSRLANITLAGKLINNTLLLPGELFSFNKIVGLPTVEKGFQEAPIIVGEEFVPGVGGGICQVSTTIYSAAIKARLKIVERYSHSKKVSYVPSGMDAAVAYDYLDLKLENSTKHPILIRVSVLGRRLQVGIYGPSV